MESIISFTPAQLWTALLAMASAIVLLYNVAEKIGKTIAAVKRPNVEQDAQIKALQKDVADIKAKLGADKSRLDTMDDGNRAMQEALLALLDHGIDGNNIQQMQDAKKRLHEHLLNK